MSEPLLTKRLHVSGLTPSITPADLERRLSSFGNVKAMDGFGARDALGDHKKFGFVTMEIGAKELAKCMNVLSGSTWKGAKLRIGEAKPDFLEHLAQINSRPPRPVRPKRTRARNYGHPSSTLPLTPLSATAAASTPGWIATPSGRVVRPMRMRPERPLEPMHGELSISSAQGVIGKVKKRTKPPPVRARRRLIDPTKWDSVYLKGVYLDTVSVSLPISKSVLESHKIMEEEDETEEDVTDGDAHSSIVGRETTPPQNVLRSAQDRIYAMPNAQRLQEAALATSSRTHETTESIDVRDEANTALAMLGEIFGDNEDWDGRESVPEMDDLEDNKEGDRGVRVDEGDIEIVPRDFAEGKGSEVTKDKGKGKGGSLGETVCFGHADGADAEATTGRDVEMEETNPPVNIEVLAQAAEPAPQTNLKALFAPSEQASFSLLDHLDLDLDLELDADILGISAPSGASQDNGHLLEPVLPTPHVAFSPTTISTTKARSQVTLDPLLPLLFPPAVSSPHLHTPSKSTTTIHRHDNPSCTLFPSTTRIRGLHHLPPSITFTRSPQDTPESIREWWEKNKSSLTYEWKKTWREARGSRRKKVRAGGDVGGGY